MHNKYYINASCYYYCVITTTQAENFIEWYGGRIMTKDVHSYPCEYIRLPSKGKLRLQMELRLLIS